MRLTDEMFGAFQDVVAREPGPAALVFAFALFLIGGLWWRLTLVSRDLRLAQKELAIAIDEREAEREAAQSMVHDKTRFLSKASHDLRQPLQALGLFVAALTQHPLTDDIRAIVGKIESALESLNRLLTGILDISRLDAGAVDVHITPFPLQKVFDRMAMEFKPLAKQKGLSFRVLPTRVSLRSDLVLIERILHNLLSNAIAVTRTGGVLVGCRRRSAELRIEVWDSGPGIALFDQPEIFREFPQLKAAPPKERQGTGLGLAIVARLVRLLGLRIKFRSIIGKGSMFAVILPSAMQSIEWLEPRRNLEDQRPTIQP